MAHLITGAGSGIGAAVADVLHARGDDLVLVARSAERAEELAGALPRRRPCSWPTWPTLDALAALELPESLDSVVHAAGVVDLGTVAELTAQQWREQLDVNLLAPVALTRLALPALRAAAAPSYS